MNTKKQNLIMYALFPNITSSFGRIIRMIFAVGGLYIFGILEERHEEIQCTKTAEINLIYFALFIISAIVLTINFIKFLRKQ